MAKEAGLKELELHYNYDSEGDALYINFGKPTAADNSTLTDEDVVIRYKDGKIVGVTILHARDRLLAK